MASSRRVRTNRHVWGIPQDRYVSVWRWLAFLNAGIAVDIWNTTQGWKPTISHKLIFGEIGSHSIAVYGILICAPHLGAAAMLLKVYARATNLQSRSWTVRVPDLWKLRAQEGSRGAKIDRGFVLALGLGLPSAALLHFIDKTFWGTVYVDGQAFACGAEQHLTRYMPLGESWRLGNTRTPPGDQFETPSTGITYYPFWESWSLVLIVSGALILAAVALYAIFSPSRSPAGSR